MTQTGPYPLVVVEWADSAQPISHWQWLDEYEANGPILCTSVGYIVHDADGVMSLAPNLGDVMRDRAMASGIMRIAQSSIRGVRALAIGAEYERPGIGDRAAAWHEGMGDGAHQSGQASEHAEKEANSQRSCVPAPKRGE